MKMTSQRFCLRWNNHQSNLLSVFDQLLHAETFTDVTLAVDGHYLKAHKMVLSACSPYFNCLFLNHPEKHPIVILKDVPYSDMKSLLDFMYRGEVSVDQERLTAFLRVAESLRIKGLTEVNDDKPITTTNVNGTNSGNTNNCNNNHNTEPVQTPQLQRIQPYMVQQHQQHQRHKAHQSNVNTINNHVTSCPTTPVLQHHHHHQQNQQQQQQESLLSSALLSSMPKRKRGRPRKLSGSSNGDYDEFDADGGLADSDMGDSKMCNDSYSGNDDISDDNQRDNDQHEEDLSESRESLSPKKSKQVKDSRNHQQQQQLLQQDDNSTTVHYQYSSASTPELSQRLFGVNIKTGINSNSNNNNNNNSNNNNNNNNNNNSNNNKSKANGMSPRSASVIGTTATTTTTTTSSIPSLTSSNQTLITLIQHQQQQQQKQQQHQEQNHMTIAELSRNHTKVKPLSHTSAPSPSTGGLKIRTSLQNLSASVLNSTINNAMQTTATTTSYPLKFLPSTSTTMVSMSTSSTSLAAATSIATTITANSNSLLKQQLRFGLKDINGGSVVVGVNSAGCTINKPANNINNFNDDIIGNSHGACAALQSLACAAERQANNNNNGNNYNANNNDIKPPTANNLHHQFMLHMAANPILKSSSDECHIFMHQRHDESKDQQKPQEIDSSVDSDAKSNEHNVHYLLGNKSDTETLTLADENAGLDYTINCHSKNNNNNCQQQPSMTTIAESESKTLIATTLTPTTAIIATTPISAINNNNNSNNKSDVNINKVSSTITLTTTSTSTPTMMAIEATTTNRTKNVTTKPIQRRRVRRKAQSSLDDPAEQLTEMSVRGLDLFRYANITEGVYQCTECAKENLQKTFKNKYSFQRHAFLYHEGKQRKVFPCTLCGKGFSRPDKMKNHIKVVHDVINFNSLKYLITTAGSSTASTSASRLTTKSVRSMQSSSKKSIKSIGKNHQVNNAQSFPSPPPPPQLPLLPSSLPLLQPPALPPPSLSTSTSPSRNDAKQFTTSINATRVCGISNNSETDSKFNTPNITVSSNIEIKSEVIISPSPSPSPPPPPSSFTSLAAISTASATNSHSFTMTHNEKMSTTQPLQQTVDGNTTQLTNNAQRLAEVK